MLKKIKANAHYGAWGVSFIAMAGSLYMSEVLKFQPCVLCWYQRILMYPLVAIMAVGIIDQDDRVVRYALPFSILGVVVAAYHNLIYYGIVPESLTPCAVGASCATKQLELFGFITIPLMSLVTFIVITLALVLYRSHVKSKASPELID